ncbi:activator of 90 kDa heat shock protein ATPase homolog 1-like isoform X2 [Acyrthosiphon pisum]|uniref:Activator of Hsp90 ATPase AHSA1-like N-terminal domain-containing protein n=1 Tax=Acyrthosiphon pisum TaxID=7029 RepID=A0A8R1W6U0_ACYPI|nr:activator of 90 kDa heat shock protein ATPase homolog 1-like isoform X2 [Acyrthosiphon pisum]|eukprot:XP_001950637.1 PREDICTED: activator of 90 kDa heat shock protein ATPase homolog 1-like [Acyrthosiphon pisum]
MAKWGEGDPRWIVEERPDATNVNNWHWTEKNACQWSKDKLNALLVGMILENDVAKCEILKIENCEGEAVANNRKGKLIFFYEWDLTLSWKGKLIGGAKEIEGTINIPNLSEENSVAEIEINVLLKKPSNEAIIVKDFLYHQGRSKIRDQLEKYIKDLKEEFSKGMILPKRDIENSSKPKLLSKESLKNVNNSENGAKDDESKSKIDTTTVVIDVVFQCSGEDFYNALTTPELVSAFTQQSVTFQTIKGGKFQLFDGNITGEFIELCPGKKIVQNWRTKQWPDWLYSTVTVTINQEEDHTKVRVALVGVPKSDEAITRQNWERYYFTPIKRTFGYGMLL